jgi:hypothetical protein
MILSGLTTCDPDLAKALSEYKGRLHLGLNGLDSNTAKALAEFKGESLCLDGLKAIDVDSCKAMADLKCGSLTLRAVTALDSPESVAVATALASRTGPVYLPNLKRISPKTLTALIRKKDVEIPLIETLEFIPEPDGSVTEDFIIPEAFQERQRLQQSRR